MDTVTTSFTKDNFGNNKSNATIIATIEIRLVMIYTSNQPRAVTKKYDESYICLGFMNDKDNPLRVVCNEILPKELFFENFVDLFTLLIKC